MATEPIAGHGALLLYTADPVASPNVFTAIAQLTGTITIGLTRDNSDITPHNEELSRNIVSAVLKRDAISLEGNYIHANTTHDDIRDFTLENTLFGLKFTGPTGDAGDAWIFSGQMVSWKLEHPQSAGVRKFTGSFLPSGAMRVDGTLYS